MSITEANATNVIAREVLKLVENGVPITEEIRESVCKLLPGAKRALLAGHDDRTFTAALAAARRLRTTRERNGRLSRNQPGRTNALAR